MLRVTRAVPRRRGKADRQGCGVQPVWDAPDVQPLLPEHRPAPLHDPRGGGGGIEGDDRVQRQAPPPGGCGRSGDPVHDRGARRQRHRPRAGGLRGAGASWGVPAPCQGEQRDEQPEPAPPDADAGGVPQPLGTRRRDGRVHGGLHLDAGHEALEGYVQVDPVGWKAARRTRRLRRQHSVRTHRPNRAPAPHGQRQGDDLLLRLHRALREGASEAVGRVPRPGVQAGWSVVVDRASHSHVRARRSQGRRVRGEGASDEQRRQKARGGLAPRGSQRHWDGRVAPLDANAGVPGRAHDDPHRKRRHRPERLLRGAGGPAVPARDTTCGEGGAAARVRRCQHRRAHWAGGRGKGEVPGAVEEPVESDERDGVPLPR
mmetsp:Transcript_62888/g.149890  ORF Transcript_62888/g.149890 Transcript_62888/m.149890 type:complete len:373 (+) Transcript_62888:476-1594(+)